MNKYIGDINMNIINHLEIYFKSDTNMFNMCKYSLEGGKKIRASISMDICNTLLSSTENVLNASLTTEYLHTSSLIIDDLPCMDNADFRRDKESVHIKYGETLAQIISVLMVSISMDSLVIDIKNLSYKTKDNKNFIEVMIYLSSTISKTLGNNGLAGGQFLDLCCTNKEVNKFNKNGININDLIIKKTGSLFELCFVIGWLFGEGDMSKLDEIKELAKNFSMLYQILDDLEDMKEDKTDNEENKNYALKYGKEIAIINFIDYRIKFKEGLNKLGLFSDYFNELIKYIDNKLYNFNQ